MVFRYLKTAEDHLLEFYRKSDGATKKKSESVRSRFHNRSVLVPRRFESCNQLKDLLSFNSTKKTLLVHDDLNLTEIAWKLYYSSMAHLSNQFRKMTGLTPSHFKNLEHNRRQALDDM